MKITGDVLKNKISHNQKKTKITPSPKICKIGEKLIKTPSALKQPQIEVLPPPLIKKNFENVIKARIIEDHPMPEIKRRPSIEDNIELCSRMQLPEQMYKPKLKAFPNNEKNAVSQSKPQIIGATFKNESNLEQKSTHISEDGDSDIDENIENESKMIKEAHFTILGLFIGKNEKEERKKIQEKYKHEFIEIEKSLNEMAAKLGFDLSVKSHVKATAKQTAEFEPIIASLQALAIADYAPAHALLGYLYERGVVIFVKVPSGYALSIVGAFYHYDKAFSLDSKSAINEESKASLEEIKKINMISRSDKQEKWRLNKASDKDFLLNQGILYEKCSDEAQSAIECRYYSALAQVFYERAAGVYGSHGSAQTTSEGKSRAAYNLGMIFKLGKGVAGEGAVTLVERVPMLWMANDYFEMAADLKSEAASYELYKIWRKGMLKQYQTMEEFIKLQNDSVKYLEIAVSKGFGPALKRIAYMNLYGQRCEISDRATKLKETIDLMSKAKSFYTKYSMDKEENRMAFEIRTIKKYVKDEKILEDPAYKLICNKFVEYLKKKFIWKFLETVIFTSLKGFAKSLNLPFATNKEKTLESVRSLVTLISTLSSSSVDGQLNSISNGVKDTGEVINNVGQACISQNINGFLRDEGEKWEKIDIKPWIEKFNKFYKDKILKEVLSGFKKYNLIYELKEKIEQMDIPCNINKDDESRNFKACLDEANKQYKEVYEIAKFVYPIVPKEIRNLREQIFYYDIYTHLAGLLQSKPSKAQIQLVRSLLIQCHFAEEGIDEFKNSTIYNNRLRKHCESVAAITEYSKILKISLDEAKQNVESGFKLLCKDNRMTNSDYASLGYDTLISIIKMQNLKKSPLVTDMYEFVARCREERKQARDYQVFNTTWLKPDSSAVKWISPTGDIKECSLSSIFTRAKKVIEEMQNDEDKKHLSISLNFKALTYKDPALYIYAKHIDEYYTEMNEKVMNQVKSISKETLELIAEGNNPLIYFFNDNLEDLFKQTITRITELLTADCIIDGKNKEKVIEEIITYYNCNNSKISWDTIYYKKAILLYLNQTANTENEAVASIAQLFWGLSGRCADGKYGFFVDWLANTEKNNSDHIKKFVEKYGKDATKNIELRKFVSQLILEIKKNFQKRHLSRTKQDASGEIVLCTNVILNQLLIEALNIPGYYTALQYGGCFMDAIKNKDQVFPIENLIKRFFTGGKIQFKNPDHENIVRPLTIERLILLFKKAIHKNYGPQIEQDEYAPICEDKNENPDLMPYSVLYSKIPYQLIEEYVKSDIEIAMDYKRYLEGNCETPTKYFTGEGRHLGNCLSHAAVVRILADLGYLIVEKGFFEKVKVGWRITNLQNNEN